MRSYELVLVIRPSLSETDRNKLIDSIKAMLKDLKVIEEHDWGSKALSYAIKHELTGHYVDFILEGEKGMPVDFEKRLLENDNLLRHLVIRKK